MARTLPKALGWFLVFLGGFATATPVPEEHSVEGPSAASLTDLDLRVERLAWLEDQMEHDTSIPMPAAMMPDMPRHGHRRLSVRVTVYNPGREPRRFDVAELALRTSEGRDWRPAAATTQKVTLGSGQFAHLFLQFDVPSAGEERLRLVWRRGGTERMLTHAPPGSIPEKHGASKHAGRGYR